MPSNDTAILRFKYLKNQLDLPFVAYADFECILEGMDLKTSDNINLIQKHIPHAYSYYIKCSFDNSLDIYGIYYGEDCAAHFVESIYISKSLKCNDTVISTITGAIKNN